MKILFKLTTKGRHEKALRTIKSIQDNCTSKDYVILCSVDKGDPSADILCQHARNVLFVFGESKNKIDAINRDMQHAPPFDILVNVSDDQIFIKKGFDEIIREQFKTEFSKGVAEAFGYKDFETGSIKATITGGYRINLDQFIHFPDGNRSDLCTMSIIGRDYYERDKYIYHPIYANEYADNEAQEVAKMRGCYKFVNKHIFDHLHGNYGKGEYDNLHKINEQKGFINYDAMKYEQRKLNNFGL